MTMEIAGVMKDFNFSSLHEEVKPFMLKCNPKDNFLSSITVATNSTNYKNLLGQIEILWHKNFPAVPFEYSFLDETFARLYQSESRFQKVFISLVLLGILIACLGLLGLATFAAQQRVKEIGIRKVLGASIASIVALLSKDFLKLVLISFIVAVPVAWYAANQWLQDFAYRIDVKWWIFLLAGMIAVFIALFTISFQAIKAAIANPVKSLRTE